MPARTMCSRAKNAPSAAISRNAGGSSDVAGADVLGNAAHQFGISHGMMKSPYSGRLDRLQPTHQVYVAISSSC